MEPAILKPVIKLFTSCVANNSKRREREGEDETCSYLQVKHKRSCMCLEDYVQ